MDIAALYQRYQDLQAYVGWNDADTARLRPLLPLLQRHLNPLIDDFYEEIARHPNASKVITGGQAQIERLKRTLHEWVTELLTGRYDESYVARRWRVGWRHVEIGLDQVYTNAALSRLRSGLIRAMEREWMGSTTDLLHTIESLNKLLDLDLAIIEDAYQSEYLRRRQRIERLAAIGQMAGGVAHELRQPLNVIKTSVYYLLHARSASPEKIREHLGRIDSQVGLADGVIDAMASYAKLPLPKLIPLSPRECIAAALEDNPMPARVAVKVDAAAAPPMMTDPTQIRIVLGNLMRNARDAMPDGGQLTLSARSENDHVVLDVADTGVGIAPEDLERIMEPLYTTKPRGMGLGLAIARGILDKLGARLTVHSQPGHGSTFSIHVPAASGNMKPRMDTDEHG